jgi:alkylhydroperoxidase/carboxymuconolactone decarboxylase family protein YurZ
MPGHPLAAIWKLDPDLKGHMEQADDFALSDGALPRKFKLLIALAFDASLGHEGGVKALAAQALAAGATLPEIMEALRVAYHFTGVPSAYTASMGLEELAKS